jgi:hypothetical protein
MAHKSSTERLPGLPPGLKFFLLLDLLLTMSAGLSLLYYHFHHIPLANTHLWTAIEDRYGDLWHYRLLFEKLHTAGFFQGQERFAYPAPCAVIYAVLYHFFHSFAIFNTILVLALAASTYLFSRALLRSGLQPMWALLFPLIVALTAGPWQVLCDRANLELFVYLFTGGGVWAYLTGRKTFAAVLWGCAGAMKIYPLALLAVFLARKTMRQFLAGAAVAALVLLLSFWFVGPTIGAAAMGTLMGVTGFLNTYAAVARRLELNIDHSMLASIKQILSLHMLHLGYDWPHLSRGYEITVCVLAPVLYFKRIRQMPEINQLCLMLVAIVLLPPVSYDYTLIHIYLVFGIITASYLFALRQGRPYAGVMSYYVAFALLFTREEWISIPGRGLVFNGLLKCGSLIALGVLLLRFPLTMEAETDAPAGRSAVQHK